MTPDDRIDIHDPVAEICRLLGELDPSHVKRLVITPSTLTATIFREPKQIDPTTDQILLYEKTFKVMA